MNQSRGAEGNQEQSLVGTPESRGTWGSVQERDLRRPGLGAHPPGDLWYIMEEKCFPWAIPFMEASDPVLLAGGEVNIGSKIIFKKYYSHKGKNVL